MDDRATKRKQLLERGRFLMVNKGRQPLRKLVYKPGKKNCACATLIGTGEQLTSLDGMPVQLVRVHHSGAERKDDGWRSGPAEFKQPSGQTRCASTIENGKTGQL